MIKKIMLPFLVFFILFFYMACEPSANEAKQVVEIAQEQLKEVTESMDTLYRIMNTFAVSLEQQYMDAEGIVKPDSKEDFEREKGKLRVIVEESGEFIQHKLDLINHLAGRIPQWEVEQQELDIVRTTIEASQSIIEGLFQDGKFIWTVRTRWGVQK